MEGVWLIIPTKPFAEGKSRLLLQAHRRTALNRAFLTHVLSVAVGVIPSHRIIVVSRDPEALAEARRHDAVALAEAPGGDLNDALTFAAHHVARRGARQILSLFTDLPHLSGGDLRAVLAAGKDERVVVIAADQAGGGTNAMLMPTCLFPYSHGAGSFWRHLSAAQEMGSEVAVLRRSGLMIDIDERAQMPALPASFDGADAEGTRLRPEVVK